MWGTDMPMVGRHCTYQQAQNQYRVHCDFLTEDQRQDILGGAVASVMGIGSAQQLAEELGVERLVSRRLPTAIETLPPPEYGAYVVRLRPATDYTFQVFATDLKGASPASLFASLKGSFGWPLGWWITTSCVLPIRKCATRRTPRTPSSSKARSPPGSRTSAILDINALTSGQSHGAPSYSRGVILPRRTAIAIAYGVLWSAASLFVGANDSSEPCTPPQTLQCP